MLFLLKFDSKINKIMLGNHSPFLIMNIHNEDVVVFNLFFFKKDESVTGLLHKIIHHA